MYSLLEPLIYCLLGAIAVKVIDPKMSSSKMMGGLFLGFLWSIVSTIAMSSLFGLTVGGFNFLSFGSIALLILSKGIEIKRV